nr:hypothetical protein [Angustibacter aerolatus]
MTRATSTGQTPAPYEPGRPARPVGHLRGRGPADRAPHHLGHVPGLGRHRRPRRALRPPGPAAGTLDHDRRQHR